MKSKMEKLAEVTTSILSGVDQIIKTCKEGENSINKRNNALSVSLSFSFGDKNKENGVQISTKSEPESFVTSNKRKKK